MKKRGGRGRMKKEGREGYGWREGEKVMLEEE